MEPSQRLCRNENWSGLIDDPEPRTTSNQGVIPEVKARPGLRDITKRDQELLAMPLLSTFFPYTFENGFKIEQINGICMCCQISVDPECTHGAVTNPVPGKIAIEAIGICKRCRVATTFVFRIDQSGNFTTLIGNTWRKGSIERPWHERILHALSRMFRSSK